MKKVRYMMITCAIFSLLTTGCKRQTAGVWDDGKTSISQKTQVDRSLWEREDEPSLGTNPAELVTISDEEFIPLRDEDLRFELVDGAIPQSKNTPGEEGSFLPTIDKFRSPSAHLAAIFQNVYFNTDDYMIRGQEHLSTIDRIASYLKEHPNTYIFVEGYCDERGPEAYNLSLGTRRSNYVRSLLVQKGVNPEQLHTISYGKEKPAVLGHNAQAWAKNRRTEFKIYEKTPSNPNYSKR